MFIDKPNRIPFHSAVRHAATDWTAYIKLLIPNARTHTSTMSRNIQWKTLECQCIWFRFTLFERFCLCFFVVSLMTRCLDGFIRTFIMWYYYIDFEFRLNGKALNLSPPFLSFFCSLSLRMRACVCEMIYNFDLMYNLSCGDRERAEQILIKMKTNRSFFFALRRSSQFGFITLDSITDTLNRDCCCCSLSVCYLKRKRSQYSRSRCCMCALFFFAFFDFYSYFSRSLGFLLSFVRFFPIMNNLI